MDDLAGVRHLLCLLRLSARHNLLKSMDHDRLGDIINRWRKKLELDELQIIDGPTLMARLKVPFTYCWSPALVPKPIDWPNYIGKLSFPVSGIELTRSSRRLWILLS